MGTLLKTALTAYLATGKMVYGNETGSTLTLTTAGTWYQFVSESAGNVANMTYDSTNHCLTVTQAGKYIIGLTVGLQSDSADIIHAGISTNGVDPPLQGRNVYEAKFAGVRGGISIMQMPVALSIGDTIDIKFEGAADGTIITIHHFNLNIFQLTE